MENILMINSNKINKITHSNTNNHVDLVIYGSNLDRIEEDSNVYVFPGGCEMAFALGNIFLLYYILILYTWLLYLFVYYLFIAPYFIILFSQPIGFPNKL